MIAIGNIKHTPTEYCIYVYDGFTGKPKMCLAIPDDTVLHAELMLEHYIQFSFNYYDKIELSRTDYIEYNDVRYILRKDYQPNEASLQEYRYTLKFEAPEMLFQDFICFYRFQEYKESQWTLTGKAEQFLQIALSNINSYLDEEWTIGTVEPTDVINIAFDSQTVFDVLTTIAETFGCEWYVDYQTKKINLVGHYEHGDIVTLQREISLIDITRSNDNDSDFCTRLYAFGSTRNIPTNYRGVESGSLVDAIVQKRLRLPVSNGDYIDASSAINGRKIIEQVKIFDTIYPKRIGTITELRSKETKDDDGKPFIVYYFKDSGLNFKSDYILPGKELSLTFGDNSWLNGRDFALAYNDKTAEFEIINDQSLESLIIPNDILKPRVGDFFTLYNFDISLVGDQYVGEAEQELLEEANKWMESISEDNATYTCPVSPVYKMETDFDISIGQRVNLKSIIFENGEKLSRIHGYDKKLATNQDTYIVGNKPSYSRLRTIDKTIEDNKRQADLQYIEAMKTANSAYKNVKALNYLRTALENETTINGGLILTTLIQFGLMQGDVWVNTAGVNGVRESDDDIAFWGGGTLEQAINLVKDPNATEDIANFAVTHGGKVIMNQAILRGRFESNKNGNRIVIDPDTKSIELINSQEETAGLWTFGDQGLSTLNIGDTQLNVHGLSINDKYSEAFFSQQYIRSVQRNDDFSIVKGVDIQVSTIDDYLFVRFVGLPTRSSGLPSGTLWRDGNTLKIVP